MTTQSNGKASTPPAVIQRTADEMATRTQAIIQSLERMCTESRTRELHKDAAIAVLQEQISKLQQENAALTAQVEAATAPKPAAKIKTATPKA